MDPDDHVAGHGPLLPAPGPLPAGAGQAGAGQPRPQERDPRLDALLRDLGPQLREGGSSGLDVARLATGVPAVDRLLGGGLPSGRLSELSGPASCGRTSLGLSLLAKATAAGEYAAWIDWADAFDPVSAQAAGVDLERVLWVRPLEFEAVLRCADQVLKAGGFALVGLDLARTGAPRPNIPSSAWPRLRKAASAAGAALVTLTETRLLGSAADLALEFGAARPCFDADPRGVPNWLEGLDTRVALVRNRAGHGEGQAPLQFRAA